MSVNNSQTLSGTGLRSKKKTRIKWKLDNLVTLYLWTSCVLRNAQWLFSFLGVSTGAYYPSSFLNKQYLVLCGPRGIGTTFLATYSTWMDLGGFWTIKIEVYYFFLLLILVWRKNEGFILVTKCVCFSITVTWNWLPTISQFNFLYGIADITGSRM